MPAVRRTMGWLGIPGRLPPPINPGPVNSAPPPPRCPTLLEGHGDLRVAACGDGRYRIQRRHHVDTGPMRVPSREGHPTDIHDVWSDELGDWLGGSFLFPSSARRAIRRHEKAMSRERASRSRRPI